MEAVVAEAWRGRRILVTGHTGFKGGWLSMWLDGMGAEVHGYSLDPPSHPSLFETAVVANSLVGDHRGDLNEIERLARVVKEIEPDFVFHLAAQPLVRDSYADPVGTFRTNVLGTAHLLEAVRDVGSVRGVLVVTTDKVYHNREWEHPYREDDRLGGRDPYSASKAGAELVTDAYRASFFASPDSPRISTARAGNVIGGGDWAADRLLPECLQAFASGETVLLRNPRAVRPWQHVLDPLRGYLMLGQRMLVDGGALPKTCWNFGPDARDEASVGEVAEMMAGLWGEGARVESQSDGEQPHEAGLLKLDSSRARTRLGWQPKWSLAEALERTVGWHRAWLDGQDMREFSMAQIRAYEAEA